VRWFRRQRREASEEIQAHIAERADELAESGVPRHEALGRARYEFGNATLFTESSREVWGWVWLDRLGQDLRYALRMVRRSPGFTAAAVLSLALGIGANTAIFTLMESALWRPIQVRHPEQLRLLSWHGPGRYPDDLTIWSEGVTPWGDDRPTADGGIRHTALTWPAYRELQRGNTVFESLFGFREVGRITAVVDGNAEPVDCFLVSGGFYQGMGVSPVIGRPIGPEDDFPSADGAVAVISDGYWARRFSRNPSAVGKKILLNQVPVTIVGVNPAYFTGIEPGANFEIWAPLDLLPRILPQYGSLFNDGKDWWLSVMGRVKRGVSDAQAQSALDVILRRQVDVDFPGPKAAWQPHLQVESGARGMDHLTNRYGKPLVVLLCLAGLVLLIACANVANLLLAKSAVRQREIGLRLALGAGRWRIVRQLLTEGLLLACLAGVAGVILGYFARNGIPALLAAAWRPSPFEAAFDPQVLLLSLGITFLTGTLFSLAPAWQARRVEVSGALKDGSRGTASLSKLRRGKLLVVLQVALSLLLLVGAGLFVKTFVNLKAAPVGFQPERVLLFSLDPPTGRYPKESGRGPLWAASGTHRRSSGGSVRDVFVAAAVVARNLVGPQGDAKQAEGAAGSICGDGRPGRKPFLRNDGHPDSLWARPGRSRQPRRAPRGGGEFGVRTVLFPPRQSLREELYHQRWKRSVSDRGGLRRRPV